MDKNRPIIKGKASIITLLLNGACNTRGIETACGHLECHECVLKNKTNPSEEALNFLRDLIKEEGNNSNE
jgi:hypothetical protein